MDALTIHEAAARTGWSPRMLRYLERVGLIQPRRTRSAYRQYAASDLMRLRSLRDLLVRHNLGPSDVAFAKRLRDNPVLADAVARWLDAQPHTTFGTPHADWLRFEQAKTLKLLAASAA